MNLQMLKKAMLAYVSAVKFIWSGIAYPLSIVGKKFMNLRGYRVYGNSVQDGTPTPDNPVEIESVGDLSTKNLFDISKIAGSSDCIKNNDGTLTLKNSYSISTGLKLGTICPSLKAGDVITIYANSVVSDGSSTFYGIYLSSSQNRWYFNNSYTVTEMDLASGVYFYNGTPNTAANVTTTISNIQVELGTTATEYEPYHKYKIPVVARGRNLFDGSSSEGAGQYLKATGGIGSGNANLRVTDYITIPSGASSLTFSFKGEIMNYPSMCLYDENKKYITGKMYSSSTKPSISVPSNAKYVRCSYRTVNTDVMLEIGSTKTEYEPYIAPVTTNIFLDEPLRKVGDYADYVDFEKQKVIRKIKKRDFDGNEAWSKSTVKEITQVYHMELSNFIGDTVGNNNTVCMSNRFIDSAEGDVEKVVIIGKDVWFAINKTTAAGPIAFKTWLANNPTYITYALATPTEETVKLPALPQFKGTTIYEVQNDIKPSGMEAKYC